MNNLALWPERTAAWIRGNKTFPLYVELSPTTHCCCKCVFCVYSDQKPEHHDWPEYAAKDIPEELAKCNVQMVQIAGEGEPCVWPYIWDLANNLNKRRIPTVLTTSGVQPIYSPGAFKAIRFSVNGTNPEEYERLQGIAMFDAVLKNIEQVTKYNKNVTVQCIHLDQDYSSMLKFVADLPQIGVKKFDLKHYCRRPEQDRALTISKIDNYQMNQLQRTPNIDVTIREGINAKFSRNYTRCYGLDFSCEILASGQVNLCQAMKGNPDFQIGNALSQTFSSIWESTKEKRRELVESHPNESCMPWCRSHSASGFLWKLKNPDWTRGFI